MIGKLRPVGSHVPRPITGSDPMPWERYYHTEYCSSGTDALALAIAIARAKKNGISKPEVIIPAYGCPDLVAAVISGGAMPVPIDVLKGTPFLDDGSLTSAITDATIAVVAAGFLGFPERLELLSEICTQNALFLIEDSAQCFPPASSAKPLAELVVVSFGRGKPINLMGGGALLCRYELWEECFEVVNQYPKENPNFGLVSSVKRQVFNILLNRFFYSFLERMPFLGLGQTKFRPHMKISRRDIPQDWVRGGIREYWRRPLVHPWYDRELKCLEQLGWTLLNKTNLELVDCKRTAPRLRYAMLAPNAQFRDEAVRALNSAGIGANVFYGRALHAIDGVDSIITGRSFPAADDFASRLLTVPCHEDVTTSDLRRVVDVFRQLHAE